MPIRTDLPAGNAALREAIYGGAIFRLPRCAVSERLVRDVLLLLDAALGEAAPIREAQFHLATSEFFRRAGTVRRTLATFHDAVRGVMAAVGFDPDENAFDVPRLRAVTHRGHESPAAAPAYTAHRDTWYANPQAQVNWWIPLHDVEAGQTFALFPDLFARPVANSSAAFDYEEWIRRVGWQSADADRDAVYPSALDALDGCEPLAVSCAAAEIILFSGAHLHRTTPNVSGATRFSVDFRTVHLGDHRGGRGAVNADNHSTGLALADYVHPWEQQ
jgi:hypothetical protein